MDRARFALVVANDQYADPGLRRLNAPAQDAVALADALADPAIGDFAVQVLHNASAQEIRFAVEDFFADRAPEDLLLLHFSCHGLKNAAGELFLAVADTRPTRLASTAVAADFINRQMADSRAQRIALFLDCCYGGAFPRGMVVRAAGEAQVRDAFAGQESVGGGRGRVVVTASSAMEYAFEGAQLAVADQPTPSVFTGAVVDGLTTGEADRDEDGWVGLTELVGYVTDRVHQVTPYQNPQMWTFGSQGELLIARSRVRRITPTPLAPELLEAVDSPLTATRFGVVDELKERLLEADLGQAYAAWKVLQRMVDDDSRKVSEAARRWVETAVPRATPAELELEAEDGSAVGELTLEGPPLALVAVAASSTPWLRVEQAGAVVRVIATPPGKGEPEGAIVLSGPTGERLIPVRATVPEPQPELEPQPEAEAPPEHEPAADAEPVPEHEPSAETEPLPEPEPEPASAATVVSARQPEPATAPASVLTPPPMPALQPLQQAEPPRAEPQPISSGRPAAPAPGEGTQPPRNPAPPWWLVAVLVFGALALVAFNWPGATESRKGWYDESTTGWYVYRSWTDPWIMASVIALLAALVLRWAGLQASLVLGIVVGCAASLAASGLVILTGGIAYVDVGSWTATVLISVGMIAAGWTVVRPNPRAWWPVHPLGAALVLAGGALNLFSAAIDHDDGISWLAVTRTAAFGPFLTVVLAWAALAAPFGTRSRAFLVAAASTYAALNVISVIPALTQGGSQPVFLTSLLGNGVVLVAIALSGSRAGTALASRYTR